MRKKILAFVFAAALLVALALPLFSGAGTASADVHKVSQAGCGASANSGAAAAGSQAAVGQAADNAASQANANASGRPAALIPVSAGGLSAAGDGGGDPGNTGVVDGACDVPGEVRQD